MVMLRRGQPLAPDVKIKQPEIKAVFKALEFLPSGEVSDPLAPTFKLSMLQAENSHRDAATTTRSPQLSESRPSSTSSARSRRHCRA